MTDFFPPRRDFSSLSVRDLLEARDAYHVHLAHKENVVGTAIGRYLIRTNDPNSRDPNAAAPGGGNALGPRRLNQSVVTPWSWPCVLVFVDRWQTYDEFLRRPDQAVPRSLFLPDGREIPTCVVLAEPDEAASPPLQHLFFASELIGGGYPVLSDVQGQQHVGSLACLVTDGRLIYALTAGHVAGRPDDPVSSVIGGETRALGVADGRQRGKLPFTAVYPGWPGTRAYANIDAGLIRLEDVNGWTAQVFGVGEVGLPVDLNVDTITLDLIGCPLLAFGCASGALRGQIQALFYRYRAIGGFEYVADLLIGARTGAEPLRTRPGDSGTLWFFDPEVTLQEAREEGMAGEQARRFRPVALQWGGHRVLGESGDASLTFALATNISTICRELDVEIFRDWNIGLTEFWGEVGHFTIGARACGLVSNASPRLKQLFANNLPRIGFDADAIRAGGGVGLGPDAFVPLANIPDDVWKKSRRRPKDNANHFATMDQPGADGRTLFAICRRRDNVDVRVWNDFYEGLTPRPRSRGALPFRVWQIYDEMVEFVRAGRVAEYVYAAGILAHYVGDACQPLHTSRLHDGDPDHPGQKGVHSAYETNMLNRRRAEMLAAVEQGLGRRRARASVRGGKAAAVATVALMKKATTILPPEEIIAAYVESAGSQRTQKMWARLGVKTGQCMAEGALRLASFWESAWFEGNGDATIADTSAVPEDVLRRLYEDREFLPSFTLPELEAADVLR